MIKQYLSQQNNQLKVENNLFVTSKYAVAGTTLLSQAPLASVPFPSERLNRCNYCLRKGNLQCCSRCHSAYFCSNDCFLKSWIHFHRGLCQLPEYDKNAHLDINQWLLDRAALTLYSHTSLTKKSENSALVEAFQRLEVHQDGNTDPTFIQKSIDRISHIANYTLPELTKLWQRVQISTFPITDSDMHLDPVAVGIYPLTSQYIRHSCRPNAGLIYNQGHQVIVALEDIPANTPITISYVDLISTKEQRQRALADRFGFDFQCDCVRCQGEYQGLDILFQRGEALNVSPEEIEGSLKKQLKDWSVLEMMKRYSTKDFEAETSPSKPFDAPHLTHFICRMIAPDIYLPTFNAGKKSTTAAFYYSKLTPLSKVKFTREEDVRRIIPAVEALLSLKTHSPFMTITGIKVAERVLASRISEGNWVEASRCAIYLHMLYRLVYPALYPKMVYHGLLVSRASWNSLVQLELAGIGKKLERIYEKGVQLWIEIAQRSISLTFGRNSSLWREVLEIQWLFERDQKLK